MDFTLGLTGDPSIDLGTGSYSSNSPEFSLGLTGDPSLDLGTYTAATSPVSNITASPAPSSSSSFPWSGFNSLVTSIGSATSNIARAVNGTPQAVIVGNPYGGGFSGGPNNINSVQGLANGLTKGLTSFLPVILIGLVIVFIFKAFTVKR
jgi:hypothetical protein